MNKYICLSAILSIILLWTGCDNDHDLISYMPASVNVSNTDIVIDENSTYELSYSASHDWSISVDDMTDNTWYEISPMEGKAGNGKITITMSPNDSPNDRAIHFTLRSEDAEQTVNITQLIGSGITDIDIPDETFRAFCLEKFDTDKDGLLSIPEARLISDINMYSSIYETIESLKGIEYFKSLRSLTLAYANNLKELDLSRNKSLERIIIDDPKIETLDLTNNLNIKHIYFYKYRTEGEIWLNKALENSNDIQIYRSYGTRVIYK